jgi:hypothetical protein
VLEVGRRPRARTRACERPAVRAAASRRAKRAAVEVVEKVLTGHDTRHHGDVLLGSPAAVTRAEDLWITQGAARVALAKTVAWLGRIASAPLCVVLGRTRHSMAPRQDRGHWNVAIAITSSAPAEHECDRVSGGTPVCPGWSTQVADPLQGRFP